MIEIADVETEREILYQRICDQVNRALTNAIGVAPEEVDGITQMVTTRALRALRVMSVRQLAVLLSQEANRHTGYVIYEPPRYSAQELGESGE